MLSNPLCPCHSGHPYEICCLPYLKQQRDPPTPVALLRSRYTAYAMGNVSYIILTTDPLSPLYEHDQDLWKQKILDFSKKTLFKGLEIGTVEEGLDWAKVSFKAILEREGKNASFHETSLFKKENKWLYYSGEVSRE